MEFINTFSPAKRIFFIFCFISAILFSGCFLALDWYSYYEGVTNDSNPELNTSKVVKYITAIWIIIIAMLAGKNSTSSRDRVFVISAFSFIIIAETSFLMDWKFMGIPFFAAAHITLIVRHSAFLKESPSLPFSIVSGGITLASILFFLITASWYNQGIMFFIFIIYAIILGLSLWFAWGAWFYKVFPRINRLCIALGMTFFFITDAFVGYTIILPPGSIRSLIIFLTWIFYAPALLLLALSGYKLEKETGIISD